MTTRYNLIVKGPIHVATAAAFGRGIIHIVEARCPNGRETTMVVETYKTMIRAIADWYNEPAHATPGKGMPDGTLLWYGTRHDADDVLQAVVVAAREPMPS